MTNTSTYLTHVGTYAMHRAADGYSLTSQSGSIVGVYPTARKAMDAGISLITAAYDKRG